jgi:putative FmdB family regulatory protein
MLDPRRVSGRQRGWAWARSFGIENENGMPLYEYRCERCGRVMEFLEPVNAGKREHVCEHCGSRKMRKEMSAFSSGSSDLGGGGGGFSRPFT